MTGYSSRPVSWEAAALTKEATIGSFHLTHLLSLSLMHTHTVTHSLSLSHTHSHTHTQQIHALLVMGWYNEKKTTDQYAEDKRRVFSFDLNLKEASEDECLTQRQREDESSRSHAMFHLDHSQRPNVSTDNLHSQWPNISIDNLHRQWPNISTDNLRLH